MWFFFFDEDGEADLVPMTGHYRLVGAGDLAHGLVGAGHEAFDVVGSGAEAIGLVEE